MTPRNSMRSMSAPHGFQRMWRPSRTALCRTATSLLAVVVTISLGSPAALAHGPTPPLPTATAATYVVQSGDYLAGIARSLGVKLTDLLSANNMTASSAIHPGDTLAVPTGATLAGQTPASGGATPAPAAAPPSGAAAAAGDAARTYVVKPGDFLIQIAAEHGITLRALLAANGLIASSVIVPGRSLTLPAATMPIPAAVAPAASSVPPDPSTPVAAVVTDSTAAVVAFLQAQLGKPYEFNRAGPDAYDCSGLVRAAYLQIGISLPHQSLLQSRLGTPVDWRVDDIRAGDLVFAFSTGKTYISHVGVAISSTQWISASQTGVPVRIGTLPSDDRIQAVRRIVPG